MTIRPRTLREKELVDEIRAEFAQRETRIRAEYEQRNGDSTDEPERLTIEQVRKMTNEQVNERWDEVQELIAEGGS